MTPGVLGRLAPLVAARTDMVAALTEPMGDRDVQFMTDAEILPALKELREGLGMDLG